MEGGFNMNKWGSQSNNQMTSGMSGNGPSAQEVEQRRKKEEAMQEQRQMILKQVMSPAAREKVANIKLVKPDRAQQVENWVINAAKSGQLAGQVTEEQIKDFLRQFSEQAQNKTKVTIMRKSTIYDDDDDDDDDDDF